MGALNALACVRQMALFESSLRFNCTIKYVCISTWKYQK